MNSSRERQSRKGRETVKVKQAWRSIISKIKGTKKEEAQVQKVQTQGVIHSSTQKDEPQQLQSEDALNQRWLLIQEIREAKINWQVAQKKLNYVMEQDQIDYAIYSLEAAEKRYEMLLRTAKKLNLKAVDERTGRWMEVPDELEA
jgi:hypothetical protein